MGKQLDREKQAQQILDSHLVKSGDAFASPSIASLLNCSVAQARDLLNNLCTQGRLVKFHLRQRRGGARQGSMMYKRPPPMLLRKAWRKVSDEAIGITA